MALPGEVRNKPDETQLAFTRLAEVEFEHADVAVVIVKDGEQRERGVVEQRGEGRVAVDQA